MAYNDKIVDRLGGFNIPGDIADALGVDQYLSDGVLDIIEKIRVFKPHLIPLFTKTVTQAGNTLAASNMDFLRITATTSGVTYPARYVSQEEYTKAGITGSIFETATGDPIWSMLSGVINVAPAADSYEFIVIPDASDFAVNASDAWAADNPSYFPRDYEHLLVLYAAVRILNYLSLSKAKQATDNIDSAKSKLDQLFVATADEPDLLDINDALDKATAMIDESSMAGGEENETAQYWLLDEDPEMVTSTLSVASQELTRANTIMAAMEKKSALLTKYLDTVTILIQSIQAIMTLTRELKVEYIEFFKPDVQKEQQNEA